MGNRLTARLRSVVLIVSNRRHQQRRETPFVQRETAEQLNARVFKLELGAFLKVCEGIDTPRSLACYLLAKAGEWSEYLNLPGVDMEQSNARDDYLVSSIMSKNPRLPLGVDLRQAAWQKFLDSEVLCNETNRRFASLYSNTSSMSSDDIATVSRVRDRVYEVLGPLTSRRLEALPARCRFGPGATTEIRGAEVLPSRKYAYATHATPRLCRYLPLIRGPLLADSPIELRDCSDLRFVPKNAKTDRTICIEPSWNIYVQLGIGAMIRESLNRLGLDVNQQARNRSLAQRAQRDGLATVDLSMASDTIAYKVVEFLLPPDWFHLLHEARTDKVDAKSVGGPILELEKFSSMGNGYTWELETLIFYCIALEATGSKTLHVKDIGVYGDDIILPAQYIPRLTRILSLFGFRMNEKKSFWQGRFFESCGADYLDGVDVRPFFFKKVKYEDIYEAATHMANAIRIYAHNAGNRVFCDGRLFRAWVYLARESRKGGNTYQSYGHGDDGLICNFDEACPQRGKRVRRFKHWGYDGWRAKVFYRKPRRSQLSDALGLYLAALDHSPTTYLPNFSLSGSYDFAEWVEPTVREQAPLTAPTSVTESTRGRLEKVRLRTVPMIHWYDLGPWLTMD